MHGTDGEGLLKANLSLDGLCDALGVDRRARAARHGALIDAEHTADCLLALARLPGYTTLRGVHVTRAERRVRVPTRCALLDGQVVFTVGDAGRGAEQRIEAAVPDHPDTHEAIPGSDCVLRIVSRVNSRDMHAFAQPKVDNEAGPPTANLSPSLAVGGA